MLIPALVAVCGASLLSAGAARLEAAPESPKAGKSKSKPGPKSGEPKPEKKAAGKPKPTTSKRTRRLPQLKARRDRDYEVWTRGQLRLRVLIQRTEPLEKELAEASRELRRIQQQKPTPLQRRARDAVKQKQIQISRKLAAKKIATTDLRNRQKARRGALIQSVSSYVARLLEVADRSTLTNRRAQAKRQVKEAMEELELLQDLRSYKAPAAAPPRLPPVDPDSSVEELRYYGKTFEHQISTLEERLSRLRPRERRHARWVKHLIQLKARGYAVPRLETTLGRERRELERVRRVRREAQQHLSFYAKRLAKVRAILRLRGAQE